MEFQLQKLDFFFFPHLHGLLLYLLPAVSIAFRSSMFLGFLGLS